MNARELTKEFRDKGYAHIKILEGQFENKIFKIIDENEIWKDYVELSFNYDEIEMIDCPLYKLIDNDGDDVDEINYKGKNYIITDVLTSNDLLVDFETNYKILSLDEIKLYNDFIYDIVDEDFDINSLNIEFN